MIFAFSRPLLYIKRSKNRNFFIDFRLFHACLSTLATPAHVSTMKNLIDFQISRGNLSTFGVACRRYRARWQQKKPGASCLRFLFCRVRCGGFAHSGPFRRLLFPRSGLLIHPQSHCERFLSRLGAFSWAGNVFIYPEQKSAQNGLKREIKGGAHRHPQKSIRKPPPGSGAAFVV